LIPALTTTCLSLYHAGALAAAQQGLVCNAARRTDEPEVPAAVTLDTYTDNMLPSTVLTIIIVFCSTAGALAAAQQGLVCNAARRTDEPEVPEAEPAAPIAAPAIGAAPVTPIAKPVDPAPIAKPADPAPAAPGANSTDASPEGITTGGAHWLWLSIGRLLLMNIRMNKSFVWPSWVPCKQRSLDSVPISG
jgi:hypothetical protein